MDLGYKKNSDQEVFYSCKLLVTACRKQPMNPFFSLSILFHLLDLLRSSRVTCEYFAKVSVSL